MYIRNVQKNKLGRMVLKNANYRCTFKKSYNSENRMKAVASCDI